MSDSPLNPRTVKVWADTISKQTAKCRGRRCTARIWFAQSVGRGKMMPFDGPPRPVRSELENGTGRAIWDIAETQLHFVTCKDAKRRPATPPPTPRRDDWTDK
jgi:hypothetical protein